MPVCDCCGEEKPDAEECIDPYAKEINEEIVERILCRECYQNKLDDI